MPSISSDGRRALIPRHVCVVAEQVRGAANADVDVPLEANADVDVSRCCGAERGGWNLLCLRARVLSNEREVDIVALSDVNLRDDAHNSYSLSSCSFYLIVS